MKKIYFLLFFAMILTSGLAAQNQNYNTITRNGQTYYIYKVKSGEGLYAVARQFGIDTDEIIKSNPGVESGLKNGQELLIPAQTGTSGSNASISQKPAIQSKAFKHTVSRGETLYSISRMYNTSVDQIKRINPGITEDISEGQVVEIPQPQTQRMADDVKENYQFHTISAKETLYAVSRSYSVKPEDILGANPGLSVETFQTGKTIRIPLYKASGPREVIEIQRKTHKVKRGETLYSIAQKYNADVKEIEEANSILASQLKKNMELIIPVRVSVVRENASDIQEIDADRLLSMVSREKKTDVINVALLLPFLDKTDNQHLRVQEYYEGFALAVKKLKESGANIDLFVFEIGTKAKLESLLGTMEMEELDLIVGGMTDDQIKTLSEFSKKNNIKYVVPFSSRNNEVLNNGNIFQVNTPHSYLYSKASDVFVKSFRNKNIIIVNVQGRSDKDEFISVLKSDLSGAKIAYSEIELNENFSENILPLLKSDNILVPTTGSSGPLKEIISALTVVHEEQQDITTNLFGYPEWQTFSSDMTTLMHTFGTYFYTTFYVNENDREVTQFQNEFKKWYGRDLIKTHPKYGMFGYDTGLYFLSAIYRNGINFEERINSVSAPAVQFAFNFDRVNNWGGFINTGLFLVHYDHNNAVFKIDKSK